LIKSDSDRAYATAIIEELLSGLRRAMIEGYPPERIIINARADAHELFQAETLEETGETLKINLRIEISGRHKK
jgi:broad-specificity NMP kinase